MLILMITILFLLSKTQNYSHNYSISKSHSKTVKASYQRVYTNQGNSSKKYKATSYYLPKAIIKNY